MSDDEFHETFEDIITSTSGSDSADEEGNNSSCLEKNDRILRITTRVASDDSPLWTPSSFQSKFSVWKDDPSSINERRQRFFKQKGLRSSRDEPLDGHLAFAEAGSQTSRNWGEEEIELVRVPTFFSSSVSACSYIA